MLKRLIRTITPERLEIHLQALDHYFNGEPEIRMLKRICLPGRVAIDVGANIGTYTYFFRRYVGEVVAYEPNRALAERLARIFPDTRVRNVAVSDSNGMRVLSVPVVDGRESHELGSVSQQFAEESSVSRYSVEAVSLDSEHLDNVGFIKVDVEQHEREVLRGAINTITKCRPIIMTETTPLRYELALPNEFEFVTQLGYEGWFSYKGVTRPFSEFRASEHANPKNFGRSFMNPNVFFIPTESGVGFSTVR